MPRPGIELSLQGDHSTYLTIAPVRNVAIFLHAAGNKKRHLEKRGTSALIRPGRCKRACVLPVLIGAPTTETTAILLQNGPLIRNDTSLRTFLSQNGDRQVMGEAAWGYPGILSRNYRISLNRPPKIRTDGEGAGTLPLRDECLDSSPTSLADMEATLKHPYKGPFFLIYLEVSSASGGSHKDLEVDCT
ncbi:hypothetical protein Bbelb_390900 [Branchiostoma belcheri]|nr:hypothetical protein Bbelb_390900 [Branchiostoma belcheri]